MRVAHFQTLTPGFGGYAFQVTFQSVVPVSIFQGCQRVARRGLRVCYMTPLLGKRGFVSRWSKKGGPRNLRPLHALSRGQPDFVCFSVTAGT